MATPGDIVQRRDQYLEKHGIHLRGNLGDGKDGWVWSTNRLTALKVHDRLESYISERDAYIRLQELNLEECNGINFPVLQVYDDDLRAIEMTIVQVPYLVDFASAILDEPLELIEDEGNTFEDYLIARFGDDAGAVLSLHHQLISKAGIYLYDIHRENLKFR